MCEPQNIRNEITAVSHISSDFFLNIRNIISHETNVSIHIMDVKKSLLHYIFGWYSILIFKVDIIHSLEAYRVKIKHY